MKLELDFEDFEIDQLVDTISTNFIFEQHDRFELCNREVEDIALLRNERLSIYFVERFLEMKIVRAYLSRKYRTVLYWDQENGNYEHGCYALLTSCRFEDIHNGF